MAMCRLLHLHLAIGVAITSWQNIFIRLGQLALTSSPLGVWLSSWQNRSQCAWQLKLLAMKHELHLKKERKYFQATQLSVFVDIMVSWNWFRISVLLISNAFPRRWKWYRQAKVELIRVCVTPLAIDWETSELQPRSINIRLSTTSQTAHQLYFYQGFISYFCFLAP